MSSCIDVDMEFGGEVTDVFICFMNYDGPLLVWQLLSRQIPDRKLLGVFAD